MMQVSNMPVHSWFLNLLICRYPVVVNCFNLNPGTGGSGHYTGGDGVIRELLFRKPQVLSLLTERRVFQPYGLKGKYIVSFCRILMTFLFFFCNSSLKYVFLNNIICWYICCWNSGGEPGKSGVNILIHPDGRQIYLGSKNTVDIKTGVSHKLNLFSFQRKYCNSIGLISYMTWALSWLIPFQDVFRLVTPGGGGYGSPSAAVANGSYQKEKTAQKFIERGSVAAYRMAQESA